MIDKKTGKKKRKSKLSKNKIVRERLKILRFQNKVKFRYLVFDVWYSSKENMKFIRKVLKKHFVCAIKSNRLVALSLKDKIEGKFVKISEIDIKPGELRLVYLKGLDFPVLLAKQIFTNKDGSTGVLYLVSSDIKLSYLKLTEIYQKRWKIEEHHKSVKQNASLEKSPTKIPLTQKNHIFFSMVAYNKLEKIKLKTKSNHFALKNILYIKAIKNSFKELQKMKSKPSLTA